MNLKNLLSTVAPALGTAIGGPFGGIAGKLIADALGKDKPKDEAGLAAMVEDALQDPETALKIKQADDAFKARMKELSVDIYKTEVDDRKNARDMAKANMWPQITISIVYNIIYFLALSEFAQLLDSQQKLNTEVMMLLSGLLGLMTGEIPRINAFWFGSSHGSQKKDAQNKTAS
jgi:hypothetical protein